MDRTPMNQTRGEKLAGRLARLLCVSLVVLWSCFLPWGRALKGQNDFLRLYSGPKLAGTAELLSDEAYHKLQTAMANIWLPSFLYSRPPFYVLLLKPLAALPYRAAYSVFEGLNLAGERDERTGFLDIMQRCKPRSGAPAFEQ